MNTANSPELYKTTDGIVQWKTGLPVPETDTIKISAAAVNSVGGIKELGIKVDSGKKIKVQSMPWTVQIACSDLSLGKHFVTVSTLLNRKHSSAAELPLEFDIVPNLPMDLVPPKKSAVVTSVKGAQQILSQGTVATIDPATSAIIPPGLSTGAHIVQAPGVDITFRQASDNALRDAGQAVDVDGTLIAKVVPQPGSAVKKFVFSLYRNGDLVYGSPEVLPLAGAGIKLQVQNGGTDGLLPGPAQLYVWGIDDQGNYTTPSIIDFNIKPSDAPLMVKP